MQRLRTFSFAEGPQAGMMKGLLEANGIACFIKNERLFTAMGEVPFVECFPELWIFEDEQMERAAALLDSVAATEEMVAAPWTCPDCGEVLEGHFGQCWNCGREKP